MAMRSEIISKRIRHNPTHRWTQVETNALLEGVLAAINGDPESFEKPTCQIFYKKIISKKSTLTDLEWSTLKSKVRNLKTTYVSANTWRNQTGAGLMAENKESTVREYMQKMCPHWEVLDQIFGQRRSINPSVIWESSQDILELDLEDENVSLNYDENILPQDDVNISPENDVIIISPENEENIPADNDRNISSPKSFAASKKTKKRSKIISSSNSISVLVEMQEKRMKMEQKMQEQRIDMEEKKLKEQLNLEKEKLNLEREKLNVEKLKIEMDERLKKYELELKYKNLNNNANK